MISPYVTRRTFTRYEDCAEAWVTSLLFPSRVRYRNPNTTWSGNCRNKLYWKKNILYSYGSHFPIASWIQLGTKEPTDTSQPRIGAFFLNYNCHKDLGERGYSHTTRDHIEVVRRALTQARVYLGDKFIQLSYASPDWMKQQAWAWPQNSLELIFTNFAEKIRQMGDSREKIMAVNFPANSALSFLQHEITNSFLPQALRYYKYGLMGTPVLERIEERMSRKLDRLMEIRDDIRKFLLATSLPYNAYDNKFGIARVDGSIHAPVSPLLKETWSIGTFSNQFTSDLTVGWTEAIAKSNFSQAPMVSYLDETSAARMIQQDKYNALFEAVRNFIWSHFNELMVSPISSTSLKAFLLSGAMDIFKHNATLVRRVVGEERRVCRNIKSREYRATRKRILSEIRKNHPYGDGAINRRMVFPIQEASVTESEMVHDSIQDGWIDMDHIAIH